MDELYLVICGLLLLGSGLARALPMHRVSVDEDYEDGWDLDPRELAYLRRGRYGVVLTVLAELHAGGSVDFGTRGRVRQLDPPHAYDDPLGTTVYAGLNWCRRPRLLALLPSVRRNCRQLRSDLVGRALLPPIRRQIFAAALLGYAVGLALATMVERGGEGSTVGGAVIVVGLGVGLCLGPRRTLAGRRELQLHRACLQAAIANGAEDAAYLADLVAADGRAAVEVLCGTYVAVGALAPLAAPVPGAAPALRPAPHPVDLLVSWRRPIFEPVSAGHLVVEAEFVAPRERVAA
jgi:uncharacterized protein (TIGR04222 family)